MYQVVSIEDDPQIAELLSFVLRHPKLTVHTAHDGAAGLALIRTFKPNLVLMDLMMPVMDGWEVYDRMRSDPALCHTPIIIVSVKPITHQRKQVFAQSTIDSYFTKPFDARLLRGAIERMLNVSLWELNLPQRAAGEFDTTALAQQLQQAPLNIKPSTASESSATGPQPPKIQTPANTTPSATVPDKAETDQPPAPPAATPNAQPQGKTEPSDSRTDSH